MPVVTAPPWWPRRWFRPSLSELAAQEVRVAEAELELTLAVSSHVAHSQEAAATLAARLGPPEPETPETAAQELVEEVSENGQV